MTPTAALLLALLAAPSDPSPNRVDPDGGGPAPYLASQVPCVDEEQRRRIDAMLASNLADLQAQGLAPVPSVAPGTLAWPLAPAPGLQDPGYHGVSNFVDLNPAFPNQIRDYQCLARTYDTAAGYNHAGIDYFTWPFGWLKMDQSLVEIVAAAPGVILAKSDGNNDRSCATLGGTWNAVYVLQGDGSVIWYGHMKNGSLTSKPVGAAVAAGEFLGIVGSSGNSTGPHLHFEVHDAGGNVVEPHNGPCQGAPSLWQLQRPYYDSAINTLLTHSAPPVFPSCPTQEVPNVADVFAPGTTFHVAAYYRDQRAGQQTDLRLIRPDGSVDRSWSSVSSSSYQASYWYWTIPLLASAPRGTWRFEADYLGVPSSRTFAVGAYGPVVGAISPNTGPTGGGLPITVSGNYFQSGASVTIGGAAASGVTVAAPTVIQAVSPAHATGLGDVVVTNPDTNAGVLPNAFFFTPPAVPAKFKTVPPCRAVDTRSATGPTGGSPLPPSSTRSLTVASPCGVPPSARAVSINLTVVSPTAPGFVSIYPGNGLPSPTSAINFTAGATRANSAVAPLSTDVTGKIGVLNGSAGTVHVIIDVTGYFE